jgi:hypothetical protein
VFDPLTIPVHEGVDFTQTYILYIPSEVNHSINRIRDLAVYAVPHSTQYIVHVTHIILTFPRIHTYIRTYLL